MAGRKNRTAAGMWMGMLLFCCITGCSPEQSSEGTETENVRREEKDEYRLPAEQWAEAGKVEDSEESWLLTEYWEDFGQKLPDPAMTKGPDMTAAEGSDYYILENYAKQGYSEGEVQKYYLIHVDMETLESTRAELLLADGDGGAEETGGSALELAADLEEGWAVITGMSVWEGKVCLLVHQTDPESRTSAHCYAVWLDERQKAESMTDLLPEMEKAGMCRDGSAPAGLLCDGEGRYYVGTAECGIFDGTGKFLKMVESPGGRGNVVYHTCRLPDGRPVFESLNPENQQTTIFCYEGLEEKVLYRGKCDYTPVRYLDAEGRIYYIGQSGLLRWDQSTGECRRIYRDSGLNPMTCQAIAEVSEDAIVMAFCENEEPYLLRIQRDAEIEEKTVTIYQVYGSGMGKYADEYSRKHPGTKIELVTVKEAEDDKGMALNRLMARITAGEKPDLFLLQYEELKALEEKGILEPLQDKLPEELSEQIFPGVLQSGMAGDKLYGIAYEAYVDTMAVLKSVWPGETWSFRDVMELVEGENGASISCVFGGETAADMLYGMVLRDIAAGNSSLADRETKECRFDSEEFIRILEFCKKYGCDPNLTGSREEIVEGMRRGEILAYRIGGDLAAFSDSMAALGDDFHCVGFPTEGDWGSYINCYQYIALNAQGENREEALDFIRYLLGERVQRNGVRTVRRDILVNYVRDGSKDAAVPEGREPAFQMASRAVIPLKGKTDGSSFLPEYLEIADRSAFQSTWLDTLGIIVIEESEGYFNGDKTAEEVARVIQSRVWLYLNEE